ncbi:DUF3558 domain-containing protein [Amycolatopsis sp. NPDC004378]
MRRIAYAAMVLTSLVVLSACTDKGAPGTASPAPSTSGDTATGNTSVPSSTGQALPYGGAPKVADPLPAAVLSGDPCSDALTPEQVQQALGNSNPGKPDSIATGASCSWYNPSTSAKVAVTYVTKTHAGLSAVYANVKPATPAWKELSPIDGFPAVAHHFTTGDCTISVGIADDLSVDVTGFLSSAKEDAGADPCESTARAAGTVVENLKKKAG